MNLQTKGTKTLLILPFFYPHKGGSQKYAEELHVKLNEINPNSKTTVLTYNTKGAPDLENYRGLEIHRVPCWEIIKDKFLLPKPAPLKRKLKELKGKGFGYVETHVRFFDTTKWVWKFAKSINAKSIYVGHVPNHPEHNNFLIKLVGKAMDLVIAKKTLKNYDYYFYANKAAKEFHENVLKVKTVGTVVHIAINPEDFENNQNKTIRRIPKVDKNLNLEDTLVTYVGRVIKTKGINFLLDAIIKLQRTLDKKQWDNLFFCFAGPGKLNKKIKRIVKKKKLTEKVFILDEISYSQVKTLLSITDVFVSPSSHNEGLPNTILEAGISGDYVIATKSGAIGDIVIEGKTGKLISKKSSKDISDALTRYLTNKKDGTLQAYKLKETIKENYTWDKSARIYLEALTK